MKTICDIFTSRAVVRVLRTLYLQSEPIPLRHVAHISDLPIFSVQNAVKKLMQNRLISQSKRDNNVLFELNRSHRFYALIGEFFDLETRDRIFHESQGLSDKAQEVLSFASSALKIFARARKGVK